MNRFLFSFRFSIALSFLFLLASAPPSLSSSSDSKNSDDAPELVRNRLNQLPQILVTEKDHRDAFKTALSMGCACKQAYYAFLNLEMPLYQGWDWNTASLTEESSVVIEIKTPFAVADTSKLTSTSSLTKIPLGFIQKNISALLILARIRYTIHQYLASIKTPFKTIEKGDLADLLYTYPVYRTEKVRLYQMICQQRGVSYPERLQKLGVVLSLLEMDKPEQDDYSLRRALRRAHETKTLRSFGKDYSPDMIQRTLNRFHLKTQLIIHLQKLIRSETLSQTLTSLPYDLSAQKTASSSPLTEDQKRLRKKLTQRKKEKKAAENRTARSTKKTPPLDVDALMKQFGLEDIPKKTSRKGGKKQRKTQQQKKAERPPKKTSTPPPQISHQNDSASSQQKQKELPPSTSFANDADERGFILVSHKKKNRKATPKRPLKTKRLPLKIVVFPPQASHTPKVSTFITPQEKKKAPEDSSLVSLSSSTRLLDSKTYNASPVDDDSSEKRELFLERALDLQEYKAMQERLACLEAAAQGDVNIKAALQMMQRVKAAEDLLRAFLHDPNSGESTRLLLNKLMTERTNHKKSSLLLARENDDLKQTVREQQQIIEGLYYERDRLHHTLGAWQHDASYQNHMMLVEQQEVRRLQQENKLLRQRLFSTQQRTSLTRTTQQHY